MLGLINSNISFQGHPGTVVLNVAAFSIPACEIKMKVSQEFLSPPRHSNMALSTIANKVAYSQ